MIKQLTMAVLFLLPAMACAAPAATAEAAQPPAAPPIAMQFAAVLQDAGHRQTVLDAAKQSPVWLHISCLAANFAQTPEVGVYVPVRFDKTGEPISGEWREGLLASGCGAPIMLNVLTQITAPASLATGFLLPGTTIADPVLQNYAQSFALKAAGGLPSGCKDAFIANTAFTGYDSPDTTGKIGSWKETWTLDLCGPPKQVTMHFIPDATGTSIKAQLE
jgi:hypothetical protein